MYLYIPGCKKDTLKDPRPQQRHLQPDQTGHAAVDGYSVIARRPRVAFAADLVPPEEANRIERDEREMRAFLEED
jgi:hypothetical protein